MSINFTSNISAYTTTSTTRAKHFTEFTSKKKLEDAAVLSQENLEFVKQFKGTFNFALHTDGRYMVITMYHATAEKKYQFLIVDLQTKMVAEADSVKHAKEGVLELVKEQNTTEAAEVKEENKNEASQETAPAEEEAESKKSRSMKNTTK